MVRTQRALVRKFKSVRNLIVTKTKTSEQKKVVTIEILQKSACDSKNYRQDFVMRTAVKSLKNYVRTHAHTEILLTALDRL